MNVALPVIDVLTFTGSTEVFQLMAPTVGARFPALIVIVTVAMLESTLPSFALNVKLSAPV